MENILNKITEKQDQAKSYRKKGDALRKTGREDAACEAYRSGVAALNDALEIFRPASNKLAKMNPPQPGERGTVLGELIEMFGTRGGLLQRLGLLKEAFDSYSEGAVLEQRFDHPSTYNRLNEVKYSLLRGEKSLRKLEPKIRDLATQIETSLRADQSMSDSGWAWADLGDCLALLGNLEEAARAYLTFISKSETKSPERALDILKEIASKLKKSVDPEASRLQAAIDVLQSKLISR